jgi:hypothetical protein
VAIADPGAHVCDLAPCRWAEARSVPGTDDIAILRLARTCRQCIIARYRGKPRSLCREFWAARVAIAAGCRLRYVRAMPADGTSRHASADLIKAARREVLGHWAGSER